MTITEQKAFLRSYTGQAQAPADFAQRWQETAPRGKLCARRVRQPLRRVRAADRHL